MIIQNPDNEDRFVEVTHEQLAKAIREYADEIVEQPEVTPTLWDELATDLQRWVYWHAQPQKEV